MFLFSFILNFYFCVCIFLFFVQNLYIVATNGHVTPDDQNSESEKQRKFFSVFFILANIFLDL